MSIVPAGLDSSNSYCFVLLKKLLLLPFSFLLLIFTSKYHCRSSFLVLPQKIKLLRTCGTILVKSKNALKIRYNFHIYTEFLYNHYHLHFFHYLPKLLTRTKLTKL